MKQIEIFDGNSLLWMPPGYPTNNPCCAFAGVSPQGQDVFLPLDEAILSRHMMFLGGIGTGKTNAFSQIINQLRQTVTQEDVMIIFDTKGDFYHEFYQPGDVVISNDETAAGEEGADYWNIFQEIETDEHMEDNIVEIARTLFHQKLENTNQPFFPNAAKDLFAAILTHFSRNAGTCRGNNKMLREFLDQIGRAHV